MTITVDATPERAYAAITDVGAWWNPKPAGASAEAGDEFEVRFGDLHYSKQKVVEMIPDRKVVWRIADSRLTFLAKEDEWTGTEVRFEIAGKDGKTEIRLTHAGLVPGLECYEMCSGAWGQYLRNSLVPWIEKGKGRPGFPPEDGGD